MSEFEVTCKVEKGERDIAGGEDCFCYYTQPNYEERIVRCKDCKFYDTTGVYTDYTRDLQEQNCYHFKDYEGSPMPVEPDGFCSWGERRDD